MATAVDPRLLAAASGVVDPQPVADSLTIDAVEFKEVSVDYVREHMPNVDVSEMTTCDVVFLHTTDNLGNTKAFPIFVRYLKKELREHFLGLQGMRLEMTMAALLRITALLKSREPGCQPECHFFMLTPYEALILLTHNWMNRGCDFSGLKRYIQEALANQWLMTNVAVGIDWNAAIVDGQHRLFTCLFSGKAIPLSIMTGLDPNVKRKVDTGIARSPKQIIEMHKPEGTPDGSLIHGMLSMLFRVHGGDAGKIRTDDMLDLLMDYYTDDLRWIAPLLKKPAKSRKKAQGDAVQPNIMRHEAVRTAFLVMHHTHPREAAELYQRLTALNLDGSEVAKVLSVYINDVGNDDYLLQVAKLLTGFHSFVGHETDCKIHNITLSKRGSKPKGVAKRQRRFGLMATILKPLWATRPLLPSRVLQLTPSPDAFGG